MAGIQQTVNQLNHSVSNTRINQKIKTVICKSERGLLKKDPHVLKSLENGNSEVKEGRIFLSEKGVKSAQERLSKIAQMHPTIANRYKQFVEYLAEFGLPFKSPY